jgi:hypothetical protein
MQNFDEEVRESMEVGTVYSNADAERERAIEVNRPYLGTRLTNGLSRRVNRHG